MFGKGPLAMKLLLFLIYILMIVAVIFVERKTPTEALLWVLILIFVPYLGALLYLIFGNTLNIKMMAYTRKKRLHNQLPRIEMSTVGSVDAFNVSEADRQVMHFNARYNQGEVTCYDEAQVYISGEAHYRQLFEDIRTATRAIYIEFYTIHHDQVGEALVRALAAKAKEGVEVFVLCDFFANMGTPEKMFRPLRDAGGKVIRIKPYFTHYRSHRKIVVIDHHISYIGGMNIGKQYANLAEKKNPWRDTQVRMVGPCASVLAEYFLVDWMCAVKRKDWDAAMAHIEAIPAQTVVLNPNLCQFVIGGVDTDKEAVKMCYLSMIRTAKKRIRIQTPYFIPDASILDALKTAAASGVDIELMIPGIKASFFLDPVTTYYCGELMEYGAKIYKYRGYIHAKTMIIDDEICCIGSVNMDMRSLQVDDEVCGVFYANKMVCEYSEIYDRDILSCNRYTQEEFVARGRKEKIMEGFFLLFAPLM